ncbi:unnamed protein product [Protopolystoma xenopodis]|uniref:Uncharacterized protein n=1 Tax=Protopolystoma xenopodis TaxID=117903 RepID=A0A3S5BQI4_9PLAT|nr:unnamed protein product [Protopolystoma xenopodis]
MMRLLKRMVPKTCDQAHTQHRQSEEYRSGLEQMASLMTDVDLTDQMMLDLRNRFNLSG